MTESSLDAEHSRLAGASPGSLLDRLRPRRIVVLRTGRLGDVLVATPALRALRAAAPDAWITLLIDEVARPVAERINSIDEVVVVPPMPKLHWEGLPFAGPKEVGRFFDEMRRRRFDLAIQLKGSGQTTNPFVLRLGAAVTAGQRGPSAPPLDLDMPYDPLQPEVLRLLDTMRLIGAPDLGAHLRITPRAADYDEACHLTGFDVDRLLAGRVAGVNVGARSGARRWALERLRRVIEWLLAETELDVAILGGPGDRRRAAELAAMVGPQPRVVDLAGWTTVGGLIGIVARLRLLITNDSFPGHLAAALDTPAVIVFGDAHPARWAPLSRVTLRPVFDLRAPCRLPGFDCGCAADDGAALCLDSISADDVIGQVRALLELKRRVRCITEAVASREVTPPGQLVSDSHEDAAGDRL